MTKRQRISQILSSFNGEEREILESIGMKKWYEILELESQNGILIEQLRDLLPVIKEELQNVEKERKEIRREKRKIKDIEEIETVEPIELYVPKLGRIEIEKNVFSLFCDTFKFSFNVAKRKIVNLYIYYPKRSPLVAIKVTISEPECLFYEAFEEYLILKDESKNWATFVGIFSQTVFQYLESIGNKTIRRQPEKQHVINDCYVYDASGELIRIIEAPKKAKKEAFSHISPESYFISLEELRERELNQLDEFGEELEA